MGSFHVCYWLIDSCIYSHPLLNGSSIEFFYDEPAKLYVVYGFLYQLFVFFPGLSTIYADTSLNICIRISL